MASKTEVIGPERAAPGIPVPDEVVDQLLESPLFQGLPVDALGSLARAARVETFRAGDVLVEEGRPWDGLILLAAGTVKVYRSRGGLWHQALGQNGPGEVLSMIPVLDRGPSPATVEAVADGHLILVPGDPLREVVHRIPALALRLLRGLARRVRGLVDLVGELSLLTLEERLILFLLRNAPGAERDPGDPARTWDFTHADVAQRIGGCREEVTRLLSRIRKKGLIQVRRREVRVVDRVALERLAPRTTSNGIGVRTP